MNTLKGGINLIISGDFNYWKSREALPFQGEDSDTVPDEVLRQYDHFHLK